MRWSLIVAAVAMVAGVGAVASAVGSTRGPDNDPADVVRRFVTASSVQGDGYIACTYLTTAEQNAMSPRGSDMGCRQALNAGGLVVGGHQIDTVHALHGLTVSARTDGDRAWVRLSKGRDDVDFELVRIHNGELGAFRAPNTSWRIARGASALENVAPRRPASPAVSAALVAAAGARP